MAKQVALRPEWLAGAHITDVYSMSGHISHDFADYIGYWKHNGHWLFDSPDVIRQVAQDHSIDLAQTNLFYYEIYELEYDGDTGQWLAVQTQDFETHVSLPDSMQLAGYDVVTFSARTSPECSPLSCNRLANEIATNEHCLFFSLNDARDALEQGKFKHAEPGPFRIFAVYSLEWPLGAV